MNAVTNSPIEKAVSITERSSARAGIFGRIAIYGILIIFALFFFAPLLIMLSTSLLRTTLSSAGLLTAQSFCGAKRMRAPFAPPRLSLLRKVEAEAHAVVTS